METKSFVNASLCVLCGRVYKIRYAVYTAPFTRSNKTAFVWTKLPRPPIGCREICFSVTAITTPHINWNFDVVRALKIRIVRNGFEVEYARITTLVQISMIDCCQLGNNSLTESTCVVNMKQTSPNHSGANCMRQKCLLLNLNNC